MWLRLHPGHATTCFTSTISSFSVLLPPFCCSPVSLFWLKMWDFQFQTSKEKNLGCLGYIVCRLYNPFLQLVCVSWTVPRTPACLVSSLTSSWDDLGQMSDVPQFTFSCILIRCEYEKLSKGESTVLLQYVIAGRLQCPHNPHVRFWPSFCSCRWVFRWMLTGDNQTARVKRKQPGQRFCQSVCKCVISSGQAGCPTCHGILAWMVCRANLPRGQQQSHHSAVRKAHVGSLLVIV